MDPLVAPAPTLDPTELVRTARHAVLGGIGEEGQRRLNAAHVAVVGAGGPGSPAPLPLAAAGGGTLPLCDAAGRPLPRLAALSPAPSTSARFDLGTPSRLSTTRATAAKALADAARLGEFRFGPDDSPWYGVSFATTAAACSGAAARPAARGHR